MRTLCLLALLLAACTGPRPRDDTPVVAVDALATAPKEPFVLRFPAGTRLPVRVDVKTPFARAEGGPATTLVFDRDVFWYPRNPQLISFDGRTWERLRGHFRLGVAARNGRGPEAEVSLAASTASR